jgi:hypothetical protein
MTKVTKGYIYIKYIILSYTYMKNFRQNFRQISLLPSLTELGGA